MIRSLTRKLFGKQLTSHNGRLAAVNFGIIVLMFLCSAILLPFCRQNFPSCTTATRNTRCQAPSLSGCCRWWRSFSMSVSFCKSGFRQ